MSIKDLLIKFYKENYQNHLFSFDENIDMSRIIDLLETYTKNGVCSRLSSILNEIGILSGLFKIYYCDNNIILHSKEEDNIVIKFMQDDNNTIVITNRDIEYNFELKNYDFSLTKIKNLNSNRELFIENDLSSIKFKTTNDDITLVYKINYSQNKELSYYDKSLLQDFLINISFPFNIVDLFNEISFVINKNAKYFQEINIIVKKEIEDGSFVISDKLHIKEGKLISLVKTQGNCKTSINELGNWSYVSPEAEVLGMGNSIFSVRKSKDSNFNVETAIEAIFKSIDSSGKKK